MLQIKSLSEMKINGVTDGEIADYLGVNRATITEYKRGNYSKGDLIAINMTILKNRGGGGLGSFSYLTNGGEITNKLRKYTK